MPLIHWDTEWLEPDPMNDSRAKLSVEVSGTDAGWARRFNEQALDEREAVWGGSWALVECDFDGRIITIRELAEGSEDAARRYIERVAQIAAG